jgi:hypothetical protein
MPVERTFVLAAEGDNSRLRDSKPINASCDAIVSELVKADAAKAFLSGLLSVLAGLVVCLVRTVWRNSAPFLYGFCAASTGINQTRQNRRLETVFRTRVAGCV